jgi:hypothetical protein
MTHPVSLRYAIVPKNFVFFAKILKTFIHGFSRINFFLSLDYPSKPDPVIAGQAGLD